MRSSVLIDANNMASCILETSTTYPKIVALRGPCLELGEYRVTMVVADLGWVDLNLGVPQAGGLFMFLPTAQAGWWNILGQVNPTQVRDHHGHPVHSRISSSKPFDCLKSQ